MSEITVNLHNPILKGGSLLGPITSRVISTWKHRTRRIGGWWAAGCEFRGQRDVCDEMFLNGLLRDVRVLALGSQPVWQGFVGAMSYLRDGVLWNLSIGDRANRVKLIYTRLGDNLLSNGSAESGAWTAVNSATVTQTTEWVTDGAAACKIVVSDTAIRGADIEASLAILANLEYTARVAVRVLGGSWRIAINRTDTDEPLAAQSTVGATGDMLFTLTIPASNLYAGTVRFRITSEAAAGTIYGDGASLNLSPMQAISNWKSDAVAEAEFGRMEQIVLDGAMTGATANAKADTLLKSCALPSITPPDEYVSGRIDQPDRLELSLFGYIVTAGWRYCSLSLGSTQHASDVITALVNTQTDYLLPGVIESNTLDYQIEARLPLPLWTVASDVAAAGDENGDRWSLMCRANRRVDYFKTPTTTDYRWRNGKIYSSGNARAAGWQVQPGWLALDDAPGVTGLMTNSGYDVLRRVYIEEIEYNAATDGVIFRREANA